MPSPDENHQLELMGTEQPAPIGPPIRYTTNFFSCLLMLTMNGHEPSNMTFHLCFLKGPNTSFHSCPITDLTMATELDEWHDWPVDKPNPINCETRCCQLPVKAYCEPCKGLLVRQWPLVAIRNTVWTDIKPHPKAGTCWNEAWETDLISD